MGRNNWGDSQENGLGRCSDVFVFVFFFKGGEMLAIRLTSLLGILLKGGEMLAIRLTSLLGTGFKRRRGAS